MSPAFSIPLQRQDLLNDGPGPGLFRVEIEYSVSELKTKLWETQVQVQQTGSKFVTSGGFNVIFSVLSHFRKDVLRPELKQMAVDICCSGTSDLVKAVDSFLCSADPAGCQPDDRQELATRMKMVAYLLCQLVEMTEAEVMHNESASQATGSRGRKGNAAASKKTVVMDGGDDEESGSWEVRRQEAVTLLFRLLSLNLNALFDPPLIEEEFINLLGNCLFRLLENPGVALQRSKDVRMSIFQAMGLMNAKYNYSLSCRLKMVQSLKLYEHLVGPMAEAVDMFYTEFKCRTMVTEVVREITRIDSRELSRDTSGTKAYALFLVELAERLPAQLQPAVSLLTPHLEGESYMLRKSIIFALAEIVTQMFSGDSLEESAKDTRDQYLDCLEDHVHDVHAHVRSGALQAWAKLCSSKAIPLNRQYQLLKLVVGRLQDKSSNVRKQAVQLLTTLLQCNPYNATLPVEELKEQYEKEKAKLESMRRDPSNGSNPGAEKGHRRHEGGNDEAEDSTRLRHWAVVHRGLTEYLEEGDRRPGDDEDTEGGQLWEGATPGDVHEKILSHLEQRRYCSAVSLLGEAKKEFPIFRKLEKVPDEKKQRKKRAAKSDGDSSSSSESDDDEEEEEATVWQLKAIYFLPLNSGAAGTSTEVEESPEVGKQAFLVSYLKDSLNFAQMLNEALPVVCMLLGSKQVTDVLEAIGFFVSAFEFGVLNAMMGVRQMLSLIFSREQTVQNAVVAAYKRLYIQPCASTSSGGAQDKANQAAVQMVKNLTALVSGATLGDLAGLEELIGMLVKAKDIDRHCFQVMWQFFTKGGQHEAHGVTDDQAQAAVVLLGMVASAEPAIITSNLGVLIEHGLGPRGTGNFRLVHDVCSAILKVASPKAALGGGNEEDPEKLGALRLPHDHALFQRLEGLLVEGIDNLQDNQYVAMAQQAVAVIYQLSELPDTRAASLASRMAAKFKGGTPMFGHDHLKRLVFVVGHIAVQQLNYLDVSVFGELKRRNMVRERKKEKEELAVRNKRDQRDKQNRRKSASHAQGGQGGGRRSSSSSIAPPGATPRAFSNQAKGSNNNDDEEDMGAVGAEADDAEAELIRSVCEKELLSSSDGSSQGNFLSLFAPLIEDVCSAGPAKYPDAGLRAAAGLSLAKFMLISSEYCEKNLRLLFTLLERSADPVIRANTIVAAGDLSFRFPNTLEPWTPRMYACLRDTSPLVRSNSLTVLTHLILNDMIKVRGQISDMALLVVDDVEKIANMAKLFFTELARKGNALYNVMPDIVSGLSDPGAGGLVDEARFREIIKFIVSLIEKDKHLESLVEKMCHRFRATQTPRQWRDLAFCLSIFNYSDKAVKKLVDNFACFADKLHEDFVYEAFRTIVAAAAKKGPPTRQEGNSRVALAEELAAKVEEARSKGVEDDTASRRAAEAKSKAKGPGARTATPAASAKKNRRKKARAIVDSDDDEDSAGDEENSGDEDEVHDNRGVASSKKTVGRRGREPNDGGDDDDFKKPTVPAMRPKSTRSSSRKRVP